MSVFVPVPYCLDDCGFVVEPEVRQVDSSSTILLSQDCFGYLRLPITLPTKVHLVKAMVFTVVMYACESLTIKKAEYQRTDAFELWCWRR